MTRYTDFPWKKKKQPELQIIQNIYREIPHEWKHKIPPYVFQTHEKNIVPTNMHKSMKKIYDHAPNVHMNFSIKTNAAILL